MGKKLSLQNHPSFCPWGKKWKNKKRDVGVLCNKALSLEFLTHTKTNTHLHTPEHIKLKASFQMSRSGCLGAAYALLVLPPPPSAIITPFHQMASQSQMLFSCSILEPLSWSIILCAIGEMAFATSCFFTYTCIRTKSKDTAEQQNAFRAKESKMMVMYKLSNASRMIMGNVLSVWDRGKIDSTFTSKFQYFNYVQSATSHTNK